jgi:hypothetical protein
MALKPCHECDWHISTEAKFCPKCGAPVKPAKRAAAAAGSLAAVIIIAALILVPFVSKFLHNPGMGQNLATVWPATVRARDPNPSSISGVTVSAFTWSRAQFDSTMLASFTIKNSNSFPIKDVVVKCEYSGSSGSHLGSSIKTVFNTVLGNEARAVRELNMGFMPHQTASASISVIGFVSYRLNQKNAHRE